MKTEEILKRNKKGEFMQFQEKFTFDDILLVPRYSTIESIDREIDTDTHIGNDHLSVPIISAAMTTVTEARMIKAMQFLGATGIHHRYNMVHWAHQAELSEESPIAVSPSMGTEFLDWLSANVIPAGCSLVIDVAHGDREEVYDYAKYAVDLGFEVWSGNICTVGAAFEYINNGVNILKVGIGPGSVCSTRVVSGCGYPQASAIYEIKRDHPQATIVADGGIKSSGDIVKALALGADAVIIGRLLAGTAEAPGTYYSDMYGNDWKTYAGMASREVLEKAGKTVRVEGVVGRVPYVGPVKGVIDELMAGVKLGMAYVGARNIKELQQKAQFVRVTQAGQIEGGPRI